MITPLVLGALLPVGTVLLYVITHPPKESDR